MKYTSEKIQEIVTSPSALEGLDYIQNIYHDAAVALCILQANGIPMDEVRKIVDELYYQVLPQTATWAIPYWEETLGIHENSDLTLEQRRKGIMLRKLNRAPMNPAKIQEMINIITGRPCEIYENTAKNTFSVCFLGIPNKDLLAKVIKTVDIAKPAHLIYSLEAKEEIVFANSNILRLHCCDFLSGVRNLGIKYVPLNGVYNLDGSFLLMFYTTTPKFRSLEIVVSKLNEVSTNVSESFVLSSLYNEKVVCDIAFRLAINSKARCDLKQFSVATEVNNRFSTVVQLLINVVRYINVEKISCDIAFKLGITNNVTCDLRNFSVTTVVDNKFSTAAQLLIDAARYINIEKITYGSAFKLGVISSEKCAVKEFSITAASDNKFSIGTHLVVDTRWKLDGSYLLNGKMRLNAEIYNYDL